MSSVDVLIIGGGPSGLSSALTLVRQNHTVILFNINQGRAGVSHYLHGIVGSDHKAPASFLEDAFDELKPYKCFTLSDTEVTSLAETAGGFQATDKAGVIYKGKKVILANGVISVFPDIPGYVDCWGKGMWVMAWFLFVF